MSSTRFTCCCDVDTGRGKLGFDWSQIIQAAGKRIHAFGFLSWACTFGFLLCSFEISHWTYSDIIYSDRNIGWSNGTIDFGVQLGLKDINGRLHARLCLKLLTVNVLHIGFNFGKFNIRSEASIFCFYSYCCAMRWIALENISRL